MAISDMKGTVTTTGMMNRRPVMPKGKVNPILQAGGSQPVPEDPTKPINPFAPKPTGPVLPDKMMAAKGGRAGYKKGGKVARGCGKIMAGRSKKTKYI